MQTGLPKRAGQAVVVIDDDPAVLGALQFALELEGFSVATYRSGTRPLTFWLLAAELGHLGTRTFSAELTKNANCVILES